MSGEGFFRGRLGLLLGLGAAVSLLVVAFAIIFGAEGGPRSHRADAFSRSAIGYRVLVEWLSQDPQIEVLVSRHRSEQRVSAGQALVLLEPSLAHAPRIELQSVVAQALERGAHVLVVLPKWRGIQGQRRGWVESVSLVAPTGASEVAAAALAGAGVVVEQPKINRGAPRDWQGLPDLEPDLPLPQFVEGGEGLVSHWQSGEAGLLVSAGPESRLWLLTDPDLLNTAGLARGENAALVHHLLLERLGVRAVVIDETLHGYWRRPSPWRALLDMPLLTMTLHAGLLLGLFLWTAPRRFGAPRPAAPRLPPGKLTLVGNTVSLLGLIDHRRHALRAYFQLTVRRTAAALGVHRPAEELVTRLDRLAELRGGSRRLGALQDQLEELPENPDARGALRLARELHAFRKDLTMRGADK